ncbi:hypothetical protein BC828DRAFT_401854 [Blastocladiella britannica]|nr:hypothetical protein BC828DRAFT_401854 [Blastocladiella britannica]
MVYFSLPITILLVVGLSVALVVGAPQGPTPTTSSSTSSASQIPTLLVLPGYANVTRATPSPVQCQGSSSSSSSSISSSSSSGSSTSSVSSVPGEPIVSSSTWTTQTLTLTATIPVTTPAASLFKRQSVSTSTTTSSSTTSTSITSSTPSTTTSSTTTATATDVMVAIAQAFAFTPLPPGDPAASDPYAAPFGLFRVANLNPDQEAILTNRSWYFKGTPAGSQNIQVALSANQSDPARNLTSPVTPVPYPVPTYPPLAWQSPDQPPASRANVTAESNGFVQFNQSFVGLPVPGQGPDLPGFVPTKPLVNNAVFMPYQLSPIADDAPLQQGPLPGSAVGYMVVADDSNVPSPTNPGAGSGGGGVSKHVMIISDIDDVLKVTNVSSPSQGLLNTFTSVYMPVLGMPNLFQAIAQWLTPACVATTYHYISGTPIPLFVGLQQFLLSYYPAGSLTMRSTTGFDPTSFADLIRGAVRDRFRTNALADVFRTYPNGTGIIFADNTRNNYAAYMDVVAQFPQQVGCLYLRNLTVTESSAGTIDFVKYSDAVQQLSKSLQGSAADPQARAQQILVPFTDPSALLGLNYSQTPVRCIRPFQSRYSFV